MHVLPTGNSKVHPLPSRSAEGRGRAGHPGKCAKEPETPPAGSVIASPVIAPRSHRARSVQEGGSLPDSRGRPPIFLNRPQRLVRTALIPQQLSAAPHQWGRSCWVKEQSTARPGQHRTMRNCAAAARPVSIWRTSRSCCSDRAKAFARAPMCSASRADRAGDGTRPKQRRDGWDPTRRNSVSHWLV